MAALCSRCGHYVFVLWFFIPTYDTMGVFSLLCVCFLFVWTVTDFSTAEKDRGVKFCTRVWLLSEQVFSPFGEHWLAGSYGGGITSGMSCIEMAPAESVPLCAVGAATLLKAVWWDLHLASLLDALVVVLLPFFLSSPNLSGRRLDVYHTSTHYVALVRI